ncbi:hypothetical protein G7Z17_g3065 [Cylindrodendrum hubeiense]|uniref:NmrA-like domain-containing protein n=1 Tax=Cylindrodendrum hubeiense TaxID=595255 RepID=A0A9P5HBI8_9HYPO|nr:hypothetical protein G7Z17_g3065 [Cylindrodendrum hubeiense]
MATENKLVCVVGATGNQGGSVARRFLKAGFRVRGLTRDPLSAAAQKLADEGIEAVKADLNDVDSLTSAFQGANVIFSVTNYWEPFFRPDCRQKAQELGISCRKFAYDVEYQQGKNIADAAATVIESLDANGFLVSTLSHAGKSSKGAFTELYHFDAKADIFPFYVQDKYPKLAAKMSCIQTGFFYTSFNILPKSYLRKVNPVGDMGNFTYAVYQMPPGNEYMAEGTTCSWSDWIETWGKITRLPVSYKQVTTEEMIEATGDRDTGIEVASMFSYGSDPGYDGGLPLLKARDIQKAGIDCPMTSWEEWAGKYDWSTITQG